VGFGGSCFQKDILNLVYICESLGLPEVGAYWNGVVAMNDYQKRRFSAKIVRSLFNTVADKRIAVLGFAFKKDTNDTRESAAIYVADDLINEQAKIAVFDPKVSYKKIIADLDYLGTRSTDDNTNSIKSNSDPYETCKDAHAIAILTEWDEFTAYDWQKIYNMMQKPAFIFDGRNILNESKMRSIGFVYQAIGS
jgi:UDPglucose 6-dehydrogenase